MTREFETVHADACVEEVARKLESCGTAVLPVCKDGLLVGLVTQGDLFLHAVPSNRRAEATRVADVIAPDILFCFESTEVAEAATLMREKRVPLLPVLSRSRKVVGVLALKDIPGERNSPRSI
jgi:CBS domain-containing protein